MARASSELTRPARSRAAEDRCLLLFELLCKRVERLEGIVIISAGALLAGMAGLLSTVLLRHP